MTAAASLLTGESVGLCPASDPFSLADANIHPVTGLSTDYLNHFNEAIMLLELIPAMPECRDDLQAWSPRSYHAHFAASNLRHRELTMAAYDLADPATRAAFDSLCATMTAAIVAARDALGGGLSDQSMAIVAAQTAAWLKPLAARASAVIHGGEADADMAAPAQSSQAAVDAVLAR